MTSRFLGRWLSPSQAPAHAATVAKAAVAAGLSVAVMMALAAPAAAAAGTSPVPRPEAYRDQPPLAYVSAGRVVVLDGKGGAPLRVRGTTGACCLAWSPDSAYLAFERHSDLWVVEHDGGELHRVARSVARWEWAPDGQALAVIREGAGGGIDFYGAEDPRIRETLLPEYRVRDLAWAGLGRRLVVSAVPPDTEDGAGGRAQLFMLEVPGPYGDDCPELCPEAPVSIPVDHPGAASGPLFAGWSPSVDSIALWTAPDHGATLGLLSPRGGNVVPIASTVVRRSWVRWSRSGDRLLVVDGQSRDASAPRSLLLCTRTTECRPITGDDAAVTDPAWSGTGAMAYVQTERRQLWVADRDGGGAHQLTAAGDGVAAPQWLPDAHHLVFVRDRTVWLVDANGGDASPIGGPLGPGAAEEHLYSVAP